MHGLINRSLQSFLRDTYGTALWTWVAETSGLSVAGFEAMLTYDDGLTDAVLNAAALALSKPRDALLEDFGIYLVSRESLRRLLRFGGVDYADFLQSLDELPDRARLALPELDMPDLSLTTLGPDRFALTCRGRHPGFAAVFVGILRAMADDYGALALIDLAPPPDADRIRIELLESRYTPGRRFELARPETA